MSRTQRARRLSDPDDRPPVHSSLFQLLLLADACRRVEAARMTAHAGRRHMISQADNAYMSTGTDVTGVTPK